MKQDKWSKDFRPGAAKAEKHEREERKRRGAAKKAKKKTRPSASRALEVSPTGRLQMQNVIQGIDFAAGFERGETVYLVGRDESGELWVIRKPRREKTLPEIVEEFDGLMENHERLMRHFGCA